MSAVPYPPWWQKKAAERHAELQAAVARLEKMLPTLPNVKGALIFGSYARGQVGPESDLDLMIVQETNVPFLERGRELRGPIFIALNVPYDLIVYTPEEYEQCTAEIPFAIQARSEGLWLEVIRR